MNTTRGLGVAAAEGAAIEGDVPCARCGYNVRGLTPPGVCPECGFELERSVHLHALRRRGLLPADPRWARHVREAAWLALIAFGLMLLIQIVPREWFRLPYRNAPIASTPGRVALLAIACSWWGLAWLSVWKLTTRERTIEGLPRRRSFVAPPARWLYTAYMLLPFLWAWATWNTEYPRGNWMYPYLASLFAGVVGTLAVYFRAGTVLWRGRAKVAAVVAWLFALYAAYGVLFVDTSLRRYNDPSSLGMMLGLPVHGLGVPEFHYVVIHALIKRRNYDEPLLWLFLAQPLIAVALFARIAVLYRRPRIGDQAGDSGG